MMKTLVIIPAYNEQDNIVKLVEEIRKYDYDYLVINDCSKDETARILDKHHFSHFDLPINLGIAGVTRVGFLYARDNGYDCVICIDGDGQHQPEYISLLENEIENGMDYCVGSRFVNEKKPRSMRMFGSRILCALIKFKTGKKVTDPTSGMRALGRRLIEDFSQSMNFYAEPDTICYLLHQGYKVKEVQVKMKEREAGVSYFHSPFKSTYFMLAEIMTILFVR